MNTISNDPKGLIRESYLIEGITAGECRSIFLDWALSVPQNADHQGLIRELLDQYGAAHPEHPMSATLREGLTRPGVPPRRRGGRDGRAGRTA